MFLVVKVTRQEKENTNSLIRRFSGQVKKSGILHEARRKRYHKNPKSKREKKEAALWGNKVSELRHRLLKLGEIRKGKKIDPERIRKELQEKK